MLNGIVRAAPAINGNSMMFSELFGFERGLKRAENISLKYVLRGAENYEVNGRLYRVNPGSVLLINEGSRYATQLNGGQLNQGLCVYLDAGLLQQSFCPDPFNFRNASWEIHEGLYTNQELNSFLSWLSKRINSGGIIEGFTEEDYMDMAMHLIASQQEVQEKIIKIKARKPAVQKELYQRVTMAKNYIDENLQSNISIDLLARIAQISPFHFLRTFKAVYKSSPYQYLLSVRLQKAHELLSTEKYSVTEVAQMLDFGDIYRFSKAFKKKYKYPPKQAILNT